MRWRSLRLRLALAALVSLTVAMGLAGVGLVELFGRHVERRIGQELDSYLDQLTASATIDGNGRMIMERRLADPRFEEPLSGLYWQIDDRATGATDRSRSLWDAVLALPAGAPAIGETHAHQIPGPRGATLLVHERRIELAAGSGVRVLRLAVAIDLAELEAAEAAFAADVTPSLTLLGLVLLLASWVQIAVGLRPLAALRRAVAAVRQGAASRLAGAFPEEVRPLVDEVNTLLEAREGATDRARAQAADLAHGLKTPLTALAADVRRLREAGQAEIAAEIEALGAAMRRHVDRQLARTKAAMGGGGRARCDVKAVIGRLVDVLRKTPSGERLAWSVDVGAPSLAAIDPDDLTEILGNVLENAGRYAQRAVAVTAIRNTEDVHITIDDDGPGIPPELRDVALHRGGRLDSHGPGAGIGLAIAGDLLEVWGGSLRLETAPQGGLRVALLLRGAD